MGEVTAAVVGLEAEATAEVQARQRTVVEQQHYNGLLLQKWWRDVTPPGAKTTRRTSARHAPVARPGHTAAVCQTVREDATFAADVNVGGIWVKIGTYVSEAIKMESAGKKSN